ncbi:SRPBCC domain-containing protein [Phenylobacterium sp. LjRoot225]|uniref:SRPBCC family protein n=1 Tax=Phenylobacterium sp. LjRoot225 TaxID=3342285 RepID=UPI003ECDA961
MPISTPQLKASMFGRMPVGGPKPKGGGPPAAAAPRGVRIEHRIGIQTPAEVVWEILQDVEGWSRWNPLYREASGTIRIGAPLDLVVALPEMKPQPVRATVLEWVPNEQLHYRTVGMGGLVKGTRYVEIEQLAQESCIISNGEIMGGLLGPTVASSLGRRVYKGLRLMNEALKEAAEARWRARS